LPRRWVFACRVTCWRCSKRRKFRELHICRDASSTHLTPSSLASFAVSVRTGYLLSLCVAIIRQDTLNTAYEYTLFSCFPPWDVCILLPETAPSYCCILRGPGEERIVDVVPRGTELELQVKTGRGACCTHSQ
jgi:hypothetical protein